MFNKLFKRDKTDTAKSDKWIFGTMLVFGMFGMIAAFVLTVEKLHLLADPNAVLSCSFNLVLNCSTVMQTWQSNLFGFPNMLIGMLGFPVVITVAVAGLSGVRFPNKFLIAANIVYALAAVFAYWLFFQSVYVIQVLCPWCLVVTLSMTFILATITHYNIRDNVFGLNKELNTKLHDFIGKDFGKLVVASWLVLLVALIVLKFGDGLFA